MADFIQLALTHYDSTGAPETGADDQWVNLDLVTRIEQQLGNNLMRRHRLGGAIPEEHYPCLELTTVGGDKHLAALGVYPTQEAGFAALEAFMPLLTGDRDGLSRDDQAFMDSH